MHPLGKLTGVETVRPTRGQAARNRRRELVRVGVRRIDIHALPAVLVDNLRNRRNVVNQKLHPIHARTRIGRIHRHVLLTTNDILGHESTTRRTRYWGLVSSRSVSLPPYTRT